jgi:hypothetical protein
MAVVVGMRAILSTAVAAGLALACNGCPSSFTEADIPPPPHADTALRLSTELVAAQPVRVSHLRGEVALDCNALSQLRPLLSPASFDASLFDDGEIVQLQPGEFHEVRRRRGDSCDLVRIDAAGGEPSLVTLEPHGSRTMMLSQLLDGASFDGYRHASSSGSLERCHAGNAQVRWSEPVPLGRGLRVAAVDREDDCTRLAIAGEHGDLDWKICSAGAALPFEEDDVIDVSVVDTQHGSLRITRRANARRPLKVWLGRGPLQAAKHPSAHGASSLRIHVRPDRSCAPQPRASCGTPSIAARLDVSVGGRSFQLRAGENLAVSADGTLDLAVGDARIAPIHDQSCPEQARAAVRFVAVWRGKARALTIPAQVARTN